MTRSERVRYERLQRVSDFGTTHKDRFPESSNGARAFADIARIVSTIETNLAQKAVTVRESRRVKAEQRKRILQRMKAIVRSSTAIRSETSGSLRLRMPAKRSDSAIINAARAFLQEAEPYQSQLVGLGLPADYLAELRTTVEAFAAALKDGRTGRSHVAFTQATIRTALAEGARIALVLDVIVANLFEDDPAVMAAWTRDRRIVHWRADSAPAREVTEATAATNAQPVAGEPAAAPLVASEPSPPDGLRRAS